jgi:hypothetical protein
MNSLEASAITAETVNLYLNNASMDNVYAQQAVVFYKEALEAHEQGRDLEEFLRSIKAVRSGFMYAHYDYLHEETVKFVSDGRGEAKPSYNLRLGFSQRDDGGRSLSYALSDRKMPTTDEDFKAFLKETKNEKRRFGRSRNFLEEYDYERQGKNIAQLNLDDVFNEKGQRKDLFDDLSTEMVRFSMAVDDAELALFFLDRTNNNQKIDLYFDSLKSEAAAAMAVQSALSNLKEELNADPRALCQYLVREISEVGSTGGVDVAKNTDEVMTLTGDKQIFSDDIYPWLESFTQERQNDPLHSLTSSEQVQLALVKALIKDGKTAKALEIAESLKAGLQYIEPEAVDTEIGHWQLLVKSSRGELSWRKRRQLRRLAKSSIEFWTGGYVVGDFEPPVMSLRPNSANVVAWLALAISKDKKEYRYYDGKNYIKIDAGSFVIDHASFYQYGRYASEDVASLYAGKFPQGIAGLQVEVPQRLEALAQSRSHEAADALFWEMTENKHITSVAKVAGSVAVASAFSERPDENITKEAEVAGIIEILKADTQEAKETPYIDVVSMSSARQALQRRIDRLYEKIGALDESRQVEYKTQLAQIELPQ